MNAFKVCQKQKSEHTEASEVVQKADYHLEVMYFDKNNEKGTKNARDLITATSLKQDEFIEKVETFVLVETEFPMIKKEQKSEQFPYQLFGKFH